MMTWGVSRLADANPRRMLATSAALTLTSTTYDHKMLAIEIDPATITDGQPWITIEIDSTATAMNVGGFAVIEPRYAVGMTQLA